MNWKQFATDYLVFSRKERIGIIALVFAILIVFILPSIIRAPRVDISTPDTAWIAAAKRLEMNKPVTENVEKDKNEQYPDHRPSQSAPISLFDFDPNTLNKAGWQKLGIKEKTIATIQNYLTKGGHFHKSSDLKKIYGFSKEDYQRLEPFIKIESLNTDNNNHATKFLSKDSRRRPPTYSVIDINEADTSAFIALPGIGSKLAIRIVNFRERLGGFYSIDQIGETYGLADSTFQKIRQYFDLGHTLVRKININSASIEELKSHPYIGYKIANPIIAYRNAHGPFAKLEDIKNVMAVTDEIYKKLVPYLIVSD